MMTSLNLKRRKMMKEDIKLKDFYEWLDTYPSDVIKWEVVDVQGGLRVVNFCVSDDDEE